MRKGRIGATGYDGGKRKAFGSMLASKGVDADGNIDFSHAGGQFAVYLLKDFFIAEDRTMDELNFSCGFDST